MRIVLLLMLLVVTPVQGSQKPEQQKGDAKTDVRGTTASPLVVKLVPAYRTETEAYEAAREQQDHAFKESLTAWSTVTLAVLTGLLALGTGFLARYTLRLWKETHEMAEEAKAVAKRQAEDTRESLDISKEAANAASRAAAATQASVELGEKTAARQADEMRESLATAKQNADAAAKVAAASKASVKTMRATAKVELRAYVAASDFSITDKGDGRITLTNFGKTPARDLRIWSITFHGPKSAWTGTVGISGRPPVSRTLAPRQWTEQRFRPNPMTAAQQQLVAAGEPEWIYVRGQACYTDIFGVERETNFSYGGPVSEWRVGGVFELTADNNDAT